MTEQTNFFHLNEIDSTNTYLKEKLSNEPLAEGFTVCTDYQSAGRGQRGNHWESERDKNLLCSILLRPIQLLAIQQFTISEMISLAIKDVLSKHLTDIKIKWPNDIYWQEKKIAGILIENSITDTSIDYSIIGFGLNVNQKQFTSDAPNPVSLTQITGVEYNIRTLLLAIRDRLFYYYRECDRNQLHTLYLESLFRKDEWHWYADEESRFLSKIVDVDESGMLTLMFQNQNRRKYSFKEIKFLI